MPEPAEGGRVRLCKEQALKNASEDRVKTHEAMVIRSPLQSQWFSGMVDRRLRFKIQDSRFKIDDTSFPGH